MPQIINTNVPSLNAQRNLDRSQSALATSLQRLSSGLRINSAKDDAAGMAISSRMSAQISGLNQARRNANDGVSLSQTAEAALSTIGDNLNRMRDLAVQSANATNSDADRAALNQEVMQLQAEIQRVGEQTNFNGRKLLDGSFTNQYFQIGANANEGVIVNLTDSRASAMGMNYGAQTMAMTAAAASDVRFQINGVEINVTTIAGDATSLKNAINAVSDKTGVTAEFSKNTSGVVQQGQLVLSGSTFTVSNTMLRDTNTGIYSVGTGAITTVGSQQQSVTSAVTAASTPTHGVSAQTLTIKGNDQQYLAYVNAGDSAKVIADKINAATDATGVSASAVTRATITKLFADGTVGFKLYGKNTDLGVQISAEVKQDDLSALVSAINKEADSTGISATLSEDKRSIYLVNEEGYDIKIGEFTTTATTDGMSVMGATGAEQKLLALGATPPARAADSTIITGALEYHSENMFSISSSLAPGAATGGVLSAQTTYSTKVTVADVNVNTVQSATRAIEVFDAALNAVNSARADLGAIQNRFDAAITNLQAVSENLSAARSRIRDTDFAQETSNLAIATILQQSGVSVLSQANQLPNNVLTLLR